MSIDVSASAMSALQQTLAAGSEAIEATASSVPPPIDAGTASPDLCAALADLMASGAAVAHALAAGAGGVAESAGDYWATDRAAADAFRPVGLLGLVTAAGR